jgi:formamidopyrimidine-DNA glycosylase
MSHALSSPLTDVCHDTVPARVKASVARDTLCGGQQGYHYRVIVQFGKRHNVFPRNNEQMGRRLGIDISNRDNAIVLMNTLAGNLSRDDSAENAFRIVGHALLPALEMRHTLIMPELPEVETICTTLKPLLEGHTIESADVRWERTIAHPDPESFRSQIRGQTIASVERRAKLIVMTLESGGVVTVHLRMTGELRFIPAGVLWPPSDDLYVRLRLSFSDRSRLDFSDVRKFGRVELLSTAEYRIVAEALGAEPLASAFTTDALAEILGARNRQIKPLLLDQRVIAGIGNIYADEALFRAGIHPLASSSTIPALHVARLHDAITAVLTEAISNRGTTLRDYRSGLGDPGDNQSRLLVYGKPAGSPCVVCESPLVRIVVAQRGTVFCPMCQPRFT